MKHNFKRSLSLIMALVMIIGMLPVLSAFAADEPSATLSFANKAQRTVFTTSQQVWAQNGITLTNDKDKSTSNVADYANPARFYKSSKVTIEYPNIKKIEFTANSSSYATALKSSLTSSGYADVTVSGSVVTLNLANAANSVVFSCSGGQIRMNSLAIYAEASDAPTHTHTEGEPQVINVVEATCTTAGSYDTVVYCTDPECGAILSNVHTNVEALGHNYVDAACANCGKIDPATIPVPSETVNFIFADFAAANLWADASQHLEFALNEYVAISISGESLQNSGKYYENGYQLRIYQGENPDFVISGTMGAVITSVKVTYVSEKTGVLLLDGSAVESGTVVAVDGESITFNVGNTSTTVTNGQVRITAIEVTYGPAGEAACEHANTTVVGKADATCTENGNTGSVVCDDCGVTVEAGEIIYAAGHNYVEGACSNCGAADPVLPPVGETFHASLVQGKVENKKLYFTGAKSGNYFATSESADDAAVIYTEIVEGGFKLYFYVDGVKTYILIHEYAEGKVGVDFSTEDGVVFVMNVELNTPFTKDQIAGSQYYLGTYNTFTTISASKISFINASNVGVSQFPLRLEAVIIEEEPEVTEPTEPETEPTEPTPSEPTVNVDENAKFASTGLSLGAFIGLQSAIMKSALNSKDFDEAYFIYKNAAGETIRGELLDQGSYFVADVPVNAKQMADVYEITPVYVNDGVTYYGVTKTASVMEEAMKKVNDAATADATKALCIAMLNYGAEAQKNFGYNTEKLANAELADEQKVLPAFADLNLVDTNKIPTTPFKPAQSGMSLGDVVYMQFLVAKTNVDAAGTLVYKVGSEDAVEIAVADLEVYSSYYIINIPIKAKHVRTDITITVTGATGEAYEMVCSIASFATTYEGKSTENLVAALMAYGDAADVLF